MNDLTNYSTSLVRTIAPIVAGVMASIPASPYLDPVLTERAVVALASIIYYAVARALERHYPAAGWLLGVPLAPTYPEPEVDE